MHVRVKRLYYVVAPGRLGEDVDCRACGRNVYVGQSYAWADVPGLNGSAFRDVPPSTYVCLRCVDLEW